MVKNRFDDMFADADEAFDCKYQNELDELAGLLKEELRLLTPNTTNEVAYSALIAIVSQASKENLSQAQLIGRIKELGETAIQLAKKVPSFAALM